MSEIQIDKNVPLPPARSSGFADALRRLEIGDSFFWIPKGSSGFVSQARQVGIKITVRKEGDGYRIWRIE